MNIICMGGWTIGPLIAWELVETFLGGRFSQARRRLGKVASLELEVSTTR